MSVVAITGCSGYIGSRLLRTIEEDDSVTRIIGVDINAPAVNPDKLKFKKMDIRDGGLSELFMAEGVDKVVHLAFVVNPIHDESLMHDIDVNGTINVLKATGACDAYQLVIASSTTAFGAHPDNPEWLTEEHMPRRQLNYMYASDKYEVEMLTRLFRCEHPEVRVAVVRPSIVYGPNVDNYLSRFVRLPALPAVLGQQPAQFQFVHEDDVAEVFRRVLEMDVDGYFHAVGEGLVGYEKMAGLAGKRVLSLPATLAYPAVDLLWKLRAPLIESPSGMLDFIRYRWTASDEITREVLGLGPHRSSEEVARIMLETHGLLAGA